MHTEKAMNMQKERLCIKFGYTQRIRSTERTEDTKKAEETEHRENKGKGRNKEKSSRDD